MHMLTRQSRSMPNITSLLHGPVVIFLVLATQISRPHTALRILNLLPIRIL